MRTNNFCIWMLNHADSFIGTKKFCLAKVQAYQISHATLKMQIILQQITGLHIILDDLGTSFGRMMNVLIYCLQIFLLKINIQLQCSQLLQGFFTYPHVFEDDVLQRIRGWTMEEIPRSFGDDRNWKHDSGKSNASDSEMLRIYSTGTRLNQKCISRYNY